MARSKALTEEQLAALEKRARVAGDAGRETVSIKPETLEALVEATRRLSHLVRAAKREVAANGCWCTNWPGPGERCSWCQLKKALDQH